MEIQKTVVDDRINELLRSASEFRLAREDGSNDAGATRLAGLRHAVGRRLVSAGLALLGGSGPTSLLADGG